MVEREMRVTLACRLKDAVYDVKQFKDGNVDPQKFIEWCDKYQVRDINNIVRYNEIFSIIHIFSTIIKHLALIFSADEVLTVRVQLAWL